MNVDQSLSPIIDEHLAGDDRLSGAIVGVIVAGIEVVVARGWLDRQHSAVLDPRARFRFASNTKTFTAAAILKLHEAGTIDVDGTVGRYLAGVTHDAVSTLSRPLDSVTFRQLLGHTSGVPGPTSNDYMGRVVADPSHRWLPNEQIDFFVGDRSRLRSPGITTEYSDTGYILLGLLLESITGTGLAEALRTTLDMSGLGIAATHLESLEDDPLPDRPRLRQYWGDVDVTDFDASFDLYGAGGYLGDAADLARFWHALFTGRVFTDRATLDAMCTTTRDATGDDLGLGVFRRRCGERVAWGHSGYFGTSALHVTDLGATVVLVANQALSHVAPLAYSRWADRVVALLDR